VVEEKKYIYPQEDRLLLMVGNIYTGIKLLYVFVYIEMNVACEA
jgi:hypothetical protein